jgi:cytoskeletal protein RodZ
MEQPIGNYLKEKREQRGISLEFICAQTKINFNILKALESTDLDQLPNVAYVRGFVQSYLRTINIDPDEAINILNQNFEQYYFEKKNKKNIQKPRELLVKPVVPKKNSTNVDETVSDKMIDAAQNLINHKKQVILVSIVLFVSVSIYYLVSLINDKINSQVASIKSNHKVENKVTMEEIRDRHQNLFDSPKLRQLRDAAFAMSATEPVMVSEAKPLITTPSETIPAQKPVESSPAAVETKVEKKAEAVIEEKAKIKTEVKTEVKNAAKTEAQTEGKVVASKPNPKFPYAEFRPFKAGKLFEFSNNAKENSDETILPVSIKNKATPDLESIYIVGKQDKTWVSYCVDDQPAQATVLKQGGQLFLQGKKIRVFMGNVNATQIFYNNKLIDPMSKNGIKSLVFPESDAAGAMQPLFKTNLDGVLFRSEEYIKQMMPKP